MSVNQISVAAGYSTTTILKWISKESLKHFDMGNRYVVPQGMVDGVLTIPDFMKTLVHFKYEKERLLKILSDDSKS